MSHPAVRRSPNRLALTIVAALSWTAHAQAQSQTTLVSADVVEPRSFGASVSVHGNVAVVGAPFDSERGNGVGAAYVFRHDGSTWVEEAKLTPGAAASEGQFGFSVATTGERILVGAPGVFDGSPSVGAAYVFDYDGSDWRESATLSPDTLWQNGNFGSGVAIDAGVAIVGAPGLNESAYVFRLAGTDWNFEARLLADVPQNLADFGRTVAISGQHAAVGAWTESEGGVVQAGATYTYQYDGTAWQRTARLVAPSPPVTGLFGGSVALKGDSLLVGTSADNEVADLAGAAHFFVFNGTSWVAGQKLVAADGQQQDRFGMSVAFDGELALIGAFADDDGGSASGSAYIFRFDGVSWMQESKLTAENAAEGDQFGKTVALDDTVAVVGAFAANQTAGAAYVFEISSPGATGVDSPGRTSSLLGVEPSYPNPAAFSTAMNVELRTAADTEVVVFDVLGRRVLTPFAGYLSPGTHALEIDIRELVEGAYFVRVTADGADSIVPLTVIR